MIHPIQLLNSIYYIVPKQFEKSIISPKHFFLDIKMPLKKKNISQLNFKENQRNSNIKKYVVKSERLPKFLGSRARSRYTRENAAFFDKNPPRFIMKKQISILASAMD